MNDLFHARAFALGLAFGGVAFLLTSIVGIVRRRRVPDAAGIAFAAAAWLGVRGAWGPELASGAVAVALVVLAIGGGSVVIAARRLGFASRYPLAATALAIAPGAIILAAVAPLAGGWVSRAVLALATIGIGVAMRDFDAMRGPLGAPWLLFVISAGGVYLAVPDTELARVMLGVALPFTLLSIPKPLFPLGPAGSPALAGVFAWVVVVGGRGRPGSVVGGLATIGVLVAEPLGRRLFGNLLPPPRRQTEHFEEDWRMVAAVAAIAQLGLALYASRVVAREDAAISALLVLLPMIAIACFGVPLLYPKPQHHRSHHRMDASRPRHAPARR